MNKAILSQRFNLDAICELKSNTNSFHSFLQNQNDGTIIFVLEKLGRLENDNSYEPLLKLLDSQNETIRTLSIKNLAKVKNNNILPIFIKHAINDESTEVRREAVSAIGRQRDTAAIPALINFLNDNDPKVVMQAIRGLLVFSDKPEIKQELKKLINHPNELIQEVINKEINGSQYKSKSTQKHDESPNFLKNTVVHWDVLASLKYVPDESIHLTFTSPPYYNARDYSIYQSYEEYLNVLEKIFKEVHRVTKEGRFFVLNTSPVIVPRISRAHSSKRYPIPYDIHPLLIKMWWEFIDDIVWVKPEASVKNRNGGFLQHRKPLGYKPNAITECLMVYRKKTDKLIDRNIQQYSFDKVKRSKVEDKYETTNVWKIDPTFSKIHSAVFPQELCDRVIKYYSFVDDLIFDPFAGSGTLGKSAKRLNRDFFLTEKEDKYIKKMKEDFMSDQNLFGTTNKQPKFVDINDFISLSKKNDLNGTSS